MKFTFEQRAQIEEISPDVADNPEQAATRIVELEALLVEAREALTWYATHVSHCNMRHGVGDKARDTLAKDMGRRAMQALTGQGE